MDNKTRWKNDPILHNFLNTTDKTQANAYLEQLFAQHIKPVVVTEICQTFLVNVTSLENQTENSKLTSVGKVIYKLIRDSLLETKKPGKEIKELNSFVRAVTYNELITQYLNTTDESLARYQINRIIHLYINPLLQKLVETYFYSYFTNSTIQQDIWDVFADALLKLTEKLVKIKSGQGKPIKYFPSYIKSIAYSQFCNYLRKKSPVRYALKQELKNLIKKDPNFLIVGNSKFCLRNLQDYQASNSQQRKNLLNNPYNFLSSVLASKDIRQISKHELITIISNEFKETLSFSELIEIFFKLKLVDEPVFLNLEDVMYNNSKLVEYNTDSKDETESHKFMDFSPYALIIWNTIKELSIEQRQIFTLNAKGINLVKMLQQYGIASIPEVGQKLLLTDEQFTLVWQLSPLWLKLPTEEVTKKIDSLTSDELKFAELTNHLPLNDSIIAKLLKKDTIYVARQRQLVCKRLVRRFEKSGLSNKISFE